MVFLIKDNIMNTEELCKICGGAHPTGACEEESKHSLLAQGEVLIGRLGQVKEQAQPLPKQAEVQERRQQAMSEYKVRFLMRLCRTRTAEVSTDDIEAELLSASREASNITNRDVLEDLFTHSVDLSIVKGEYETATDLFSQFAERFPERSGTFATKFFLDCSANNECPESERNKFKQAALVAGVAEERLDSLRAKVRESLEKSKAEKLNEVLYSFAAIVNDVRKNVSESAAEDLLQFARRYVPDFEASKLKRDFSEKMKARSKEFIEKHRTVTEYEVSYDKTNGRPRNPKLKQGGAKIPKLVGERSEREKPPEFSEQKQLERRSKDFAKSIRKFRDENKITEAKELLQEALAENPKSIELVTLRFSFALRDLDRDAAEKCLSALHGAVAEDFYEKLDEQFIRRFGKSKGAPTQSRVLDELGTRVPSDRIARIVTGYRPEKPKPKK